MPFCRNLLAKTLFATAVAVCLIGTSFAENHPYPAAELSGWYYVGSLGEHKIGLNITYAVSNHLRGHYFYWKHLVDITLEGEIVGPRDLVLHEVDNTGKERGGFKLHLAEKDPAFKGETLSIERLTGEWRSSSGESFKVNLSAIHGFGAGGHEYAIAGANLSDKEVEANIQKFYFAVLKGDRNTAAKFVAYPMRVNYKTRLLIRNQKQFLMSYDKVFTPAFVKHLKTDVPHDMFANYQGIMIADGAVWFNADGLASIINPR